MTLALAPAVATWQPPGPSRLLLTCDHASARMPWPHRWPAQDLDLVGQHWSYDLGAAALTHALAQRLGAPALLSRFSRLLVDPNRALDHPTLVPQRAGQHRLALNDQLTAQQKATRLQTLYRPYHAAIDAAVAKLVAAAASGAGSNRSLDSGQLLLVSVHTFTPCYEGQRRSLHGGVLFDAHEQLAAQLCASLCQAGWRFEENAPYSGYDGLIFGVSQHGHAHGCPYLELEVRQDLACEPSTRAALVEAIARGCEQILHTLAPA